VDLSELNKFKPTQLVIRPTCCGATLRGYSEFERLMAKMHSGKT